ncbi:GNAT family N-acetyltransferase [Lysinibacillus sp. 54212]|uniref:GNAT family N-acetyltransferase n=1 Tax=Lysinibacillus sp. 54212 TaxID=3119829 RepID=UPI002FCAEF49
MKNYVTIETRLITLDDFECIQNFTCGNTSIENFLKQEAYYLTITRECSTTLAFDRGELIGFFSLRKSSLQLELENESIDYPCLDIARIATQKGKQELGYGTFLINQIFEIAHTVNDRFITLEALIERYAWYKKRGFEALIEEEALSSNQDGLVYMMADLYDERLVEMFFEE